MRNFTSLLLAAMVATGASAAQPAHIAAQSLSSTPQATAKVKNPERFAKYSTTSAPGQRAMAKKLSKARRAAIEAPDIIEGMPQGKVQQYSTDGYQFYTSWFSVYFSYNTGAATAFIEGEDNTVYLYSPVTSYHSDSSVKGTREGNTMTFEFPQTIEMLETYTGDIIPIYAAMLDKVVDDEGYIDYVMSDDQTATYTIDGDQIFLDLGYEPVIDDEGYVEEYPDRILGIVEIVEDNSGEEVIYWTGNGDASDVFTPFNDKLVEVSTGVEFADWTMSSSNYGRKAGIAFDGTDVYFKGFYRDAVIKGTVDGTKITFPAGQYIGTGSGVYLYNSGGTEDPEDPGYFYYSDHITFDYDAASGRMTAEPGSALFINGAKDRIYYLTYFVEPLLVKEDVPFVPQPQDPYDLEYVDYMDDWGEAYFDFDLSNITADGHMLNPDNYYYEIYVDGEQETFYTDEYPGFGGDMDQFPYNFEGDGDIYISGAMREFTLYAYDIETLGVKAYYKDGDKLYETNLVTINLSGTEGIADTSVAAKTIASETFYNLQGQRVDNPSNGIFVSRVTFTDGTQKTFKVAKH